MLRRLHLTDFQSHHSTDLSFGSLTVIVGPSSSGKSAIIRALGAVTHNLRGTSAVRNGARTTKLVLATEFGAVSLEKGAQVSKYSLARNGTPEDVQVFTKCGTGVPEEIDRWLALGDSRLWLAGQFDAPYLLTETGSAVAAQLGRLTNVTIIYQAVRECNRRASEAARELKFVAAELDNARAELQNYLDLPSQLAAAQRAQESLAAATELRAKQTALAERLGAAAAASERLVTARSAVRPVPCLNGLEAISDRRSRLMSALTLHGEAADRVVRVTVAQRDVPDVEKLTSLAHTRASLRKVLRTAALAEGDHGRLVADAVSSQRELEEAQGRLLAALRAAGECPLCGASTEHAHPERVGLSPS